MNTARRQKCRTRGSAIALILLVIILLFIMGLALTDLGLRSRLFALRTATGIAARCAADAGLTKAMFEMNQKLEEDSWNDSNLPVATNEALPGCDSTYSYTVTPDANNQYLIQSIGSSGISQKTVNATLTIEGLFEYAIFADNTIVLKNGTTIDGYNFDADDSPLKIGTNSTAAGAITAKVGVTIDGDVAVGTGGVIDVVIDTRAEAAITGTSYVLTEPRELPSITVPDALLAMPSQGTITTNTTISSSGKYDSINLGSTGDTITVDGDVTLYVVGNIRIGNSDTFIIADANTNPDASLTLYVGGSITTDSGATVNNATMDPTKFITYGLDTCLTIDFKHAGIFYGAIYAPNAAVHLYNNVEVYGAVVCDSFVQDVDADFHYDASLRDVSINDPGVKFVTTRWNEQ
ncbi:MAG: hypothetical protein JSW23_11395 [Planctomycetota bacterium]|nr:MAG: hypothetical protein JSW23_11395 [Planctomycetota bacterium]